MKFEIIILLICLGAHLSYQSEQIEEVQEIEKFNPDTRIVGGREARAGEFKPIVSLRYERKHFCAGALISPSKVITAAHCITQRGKLLPQNIIKSMSVVGDNILINTATKEEQVRQISTVVAHPEYLHYPPKHDVAIITVDAPFKATPTFSPVNVTDSEPVDYESCVVAGWGAIREQGSASPFLKILYLPTLPRATCNIKEAYNNALSDAHLCAGTMQGGIDTCQGDSGGAMICDNVIKGIVSYGKGCAKPNKPGIYTNVYIHRKWIQANSSSSIHPAAIFLFATLLLSLLSFNLIIN